jgi:large subunit ribosomal protein L9
MMVILKENVDNLGIVGDVVKVSDGYARNFLLPRHLALVADEAQLALLDHHKRLLEKKRLVQKAATKELAQKIEGLKVSISKKSGEADRLFGSVSASHIYDAVIALGYVIPKGAVFLDQPIKELGSFPVSIRLDKEVTALIQVEITKEA